MRYAYTVAQSRAADQAAQCATSESELIDRASSAVARRAAVMLGAVYGAHVVVLAGAGHNGADALWAGAKLQQRGARVDVLLTAQPRDEHSAAPLRRLRQWGSREVTVETLRDCDLVIDGLVGIGCTGTLRSPELAAAASAAPLVLAVDVPSGVHADTGGVSGAAVRADVTVTFGGLKPGLLVDPGAEHAGQVEVADIGLGQYLAPSPVRILDADDVATAFPTPPTESSKYTRGVVGVVAGSDVYPGAAVLCCGAAVVSGAGLVRLVSSAASVGVVRAAWPEVVAEVSDEPASIAAADKVTAWVVGPGMGTDDRAGELVHSVLGTDRPVIVDADGLTIVARDLQLLRRSAPTVITPHLGEFVRLVGGNADDVRADRIGAARAAAQRLGVVVLLKGTTTVIAAPDGTAYVNPTGTPWLATAGTGDVLSGVIGTLLAAGQAPLGAAAVGAWVHGLAGRLGSTRGAGSGSISATDVLRQLPLAIEAAHN